MSLVCRDRINVYDPERGIHILLEKDDGGAAVLEGDQTTLRYTLYIQIGRDHLFRDHLSTEYFMKERETAVVRSGRSLRLAFVYRILIPELNLNRHIAGILSKSGGKSPLPYDLLSLKADIREAFLSRHRFLYDNRDVIVPEPEILFVSDHLSVS